MYIRHICIPSICAYMEWIYGHVHICIYLNIHIYTYIYTYTYVSIHICTDIRLQIVTPKGVLRLARCKTSATHEGYWASSSRHRPHRKINVTSKSPVGDISVVTLIRTDTTLDHSQKAEKVCVEQPASKAAGEQCKHRSVSHSGCASAALCISASPLAEAIDPRRNSNICNCCSLGRCKDSLEVCRPGLA